MRVLITGAAGSLGRVVLPGLRERGHEVVGLDLTPPPAGEAGAWHTVDCADPDAVEAVFAAQVTAGAPIEAVVHLAGHPGEGDLAASLASHTTTTAALLEAMVSHQVQRFVYASSNHAVGNTPHGVHSPLDPLPVDVAPRPDTFYGVAKVAAEALMSLYADRHGIDAVACRIGSFQEQPQSQRQLATWLSPGDCVRMVEASLTATAPGFAVLYGISANARAWWDLDAGRALGYEPVDDSEAFAAEIQAGEHDAVEASRVGGPFATEEFYRSAF